MAGSLKVDLLDRSITQRIFTVSFIGSKREVAISVDISVIMSSIYSLAAYESIDKRNSFGYGL